MPKASHFMYQLYQDKLFYSEILKDVIRKIMSNTKVVPVYEVYKLSKKNHCLSSLGTL